jgi:hypothetical protein
MFAWEPDPPPIPDDPLALAVKLTVVDAVSLPTAPESLVDKAETEPGVRIACPGEPEATAENCASGGAADKRAGTKAPARITKASVAICRPGFLGLAQEPLLPERN